MLDLYKHYAKSGIYEFVTDAEFTNGIKKRVSARAYIKDEEVNKGMKKKIMIKNCITMSSCVGK